ncbi:hypothetical protein RV05_GL001903 [Enterococcus hirae]|nr:hypothetical protein RV05_GL001903 [Enterococcus hirae]
MLLISPDPACGKLFFATFFTQKANQNIRNDWLFSVIYRNSFST